MLEDELQGLQNRINKYQSLTNSIINTQCNIEFLKEDKCRLTIKASSSVQFGLDEDHDEELHRFLIQKLEEELNCYHSLRNAL